MCVCVYIKHIENSLYTPDTTYSSSYFNDSINILITKNFPSFWKVSFPKKKSFLSTFKAPNWLFCSSTFRLVHEFIFCAAGLRVSGPGYGEDVRLQEAGKEAHQKEKRRIHGSEREADSGKSQQSVRRKCFLLTFVLKKKISWGSRNAASLRRISAFKMALALTFNSLCNFYNIFRLILWQIDIR